MTLAVHPEFGRPWWKHLIAALGLVVAWTAAFLVLIGIIFYFSTSCVGAEVDGVVPAPASPRGELVCGGGTSWFWVVVLALMTMAAAGASMAWARQRLVWFIVAVLLAPGIPAGAVLTVSTLVRADCTAAEWAAHGIEGCERDRERR